MATQKIFRQPIKLDASGTTINDSKAIFEVNSTSKGSLPVPRMLESERTAISALSAPNGLLVYQTDNNNGFYVANGAAWVSLLRPRLQTTTSLALPVINTNYIDYYELTAQSVDITSFTTNLLGNPLPGQKLWISITGTASRVITWGASFEASTIALPTTTVGTARLDVGFIWNSATSKWRCVGTC
jgi:hypothetical protein